MLANRKTKIICTIGPASESKEMMTKLVENGMNIIRLNFSHGDFEEHGNRIRNIREVVKETGKNIAILLDTKGPDTGTLNWMKKVKIGALIENPEYMGSETLFDNLRFLYQLTSPFHKQEVEMLVNRFNLALYNKKPLKKYSVGMLQKVGIIQAIMEHQDFIMLDEPMRGLDKEAQQTFYEIIQELHEEGKTVIIASHDVMDEIEFDRKLCVENGKIMEL